MGRPLDAERLRQAFEALGADLAARGVFVELAVYGGGALILQFAWRRSTWDVDAVVREGFDEAAIAPSVARALAAHPGIGDVEGLSALYASIYGEPPPIEAKLRFPSVVATPS